MPHPMPSTATASPLAGFSTSHLIAELLDRRARRLASVAKIDAAIGHANDYSLSDARLVRAIADAIAHETNLESGQVLIERNRHEYALSPRKLLHWWLRTQAGWTFERIGLHCQRDHGAIQNSIAKVAADLDFFLPVIERIRQRMELAKIAIA